MASIDNGSELTLVNLAAVFSSIYAADAIIALAAAAVMWQRRQSPAAMPLGLMLLAAALWALCDAIELQMPTVAQKQFVSQICYIGIVACVPLLFEAALVLSGKGQWLTRRLWITVWVIPAMSLLFAWTNDWHHWMWTAIVPPSGALPFSIYQHGWWFYVLMAHNYLLMIIATVLLVRAIRVVSHDFRPAMVMVVVAVLLPWAGNLAYNLQLGPWPGLNWLTLSLGVSGWVAVWVVLGEGLLDLLPRARHAVLEMMCDGVMVIDRGGRVVFANQVARQSFVLDATTLAGAMELGSLQAAPVEWRGEAQVEGKDRQQRWLDLRMGPIFDRWGALSGRIVVARDVTMQKQLEDEREQLIDDLQDALGRLTRLEGLLPICASCHSVRDDEGNWRTMEDYLGSRTPVEFTHGICPSCAQDLYPELSADRHATLEAPRKRQAG